MKTGLLWHNLWLSWSITSLKSQLMKKTILFNTILIVFYYVVMRVIGM